MSLKRSIVITFLACLMLGAQSCSFDKIYQKAQRHKVYDLEQITFKDLITKYMVKDKASVGTVEGIYTVSILIVKKGKGLLSSTEKEKTVERKENYGKVAIIRDPGNANREFLEVSMDKEFQPSFSVIGEFSHASDGNLLIYKHFASNGKSQSYTFTYDKATDILEGIRTENNGSFTYTYKLTYIKLLPKLNNI